MSKRSEDAGTSSAEQLFAVIPADVTTGPQGESLSAQEIVEVRRHRAREWARVGFTDPRVVTAWISAGVVSPEVAATARRRGYRPGDPWVPRGYSGDPAWTGYAAEPVAGLVTAWRNRRRARRSWRRRQQSTARGRARLHHAATTMRQRVTAGSGSVGVLTAFDLAAACEAGPDPELIVGALDALGTQARAVRELASAMVNHRDTHTVEESARWLQDEFATAVFPSADTTPLDRYGDPTGWLTQEALSLADYAGYLQAFLAPIRQHLNHLSDAEQQHGRRELELIATDLDTARQAWQNLATRDS